MDIKTGLAIYNQPWLIEPQAALRMLKYWEQVVAGKEAWSYSRILSYKDDGPKEKVLSQYEFRQQFLGSSDIMLSPSSRYDLKDFKGFDGARIAVIPVSGPLMKADFCGDFGTESLKQMVQLAGKAESVETIAFVFDTPGGTVDGNEAFANAIKGSPKKTVGIVAGMCCSAGYWLGSSCNELYITAETDIVGSIGTMMAWRDYSKMEEEMGIVEHQVFATRNKDKNRSFAEAQDGDYKLLISETLDPLNNVFLKTVKENRKGKINLKKEDVLTGKTYVGTANIENGLVDGISSFEHLMDKLLSKTSNNNPTKTYKMSQKILAFGAVLAAAKASAFPVVEGGFLLTEDQLNSIDAKLDQDQVTAATTAAALKAFQGREEQFSAAAKTAQDLIAANQKISQLDGDLKAAQEQVAKLSKEPGATFAQPAAGTHGDPDPEGKDNKPKKSYSFDQVADALLS